MNASSDVPYPDLGSAYEILDVLGEGGMGTVYLARDVRHERQVAVKTIRRDFVTPEVSRRFEREIRVTSRLQHPRILPLLDSGVADGALYYVMQFIEGESLEERLEREGPLPIEDALRIARHVADALAYAHERDVVHRDIKPANVMLSDGHAFVMDFGIARAVAEGGTSLTSTGSAIGTPRYMSPEQVSDSTAVDGRSDIYSLGCVLYEMIAGQPPFMGPTVDSVLRQHLASEPPTLGVHRPGTPPRVDAIVTRALQKSPADRFQSARELTEILRELTSGGAERVSPSSSLRTGAIVIIAYLFGAWGLIALVERVAQAAALPSWTVPFAIVLLLIGLLVTAATTVVQTWGRAGGTRSGGTDPGATGPRGTGSRAGGALRTRDRLRALLRWRNVLAGGVLALALWGLVAAFLIWRDRPAGIEGASRQLAAAPAEPEGDRSTIGSADDPDDSGGVARGENEPVDSA
ncbi:MAG: serine/threonine-protein kinase, partial [Gemmatimonadota bacterium]|nr:serine/threonine-protein kinase [Gemmatimonadota bacterium]